MQYLITGASTFSVGNAGDDAMLWSLVKGLRIADPECGIVLMCRHPSASLDRALNIRSIANIDHDTKAASTGRWFFGFNPMDGHGHLDIIRSELLACDAVILAGNCFMEISPNEFMRGVASYSMLIGQWALLFGRKLYLHGLAVHPNITGALTKEIARFLCHNARIVQVREDFTRKCLLDAGVNGSNIVVTADPAYGIPVFEAAEGAALLATADIRPTRRLIGFDWRIPYWKSDYEQIKRETAIAAESCDLLCKRLDADLLFLPNCTYNIDTPWEDDRTHHRAIREQMQLKDRAHLWDRPVAINEVLSIYPTLYLHIANRRHACISAAVHGVPFISLVTEHINHFRPFLATLGMEGQSIPILDLKPSALTLLAEQTCLDRENLIASMNKIIPKLRQKTIAAASAIVADAREA